MHGYNQLTNPYYVCPISLSIDYLSIKTTIIHFLLLHLTISNSFCLYFTPLDTHTHTHIKTCRFFFIPVLWTNHTHTHTRRSLSVPVPWIHHTHAHIHTHTRRPLFVPFQWIHHTHAHTHTCRPLFVPVHFTSALLAPYPGEGSAVRIRRLQKFLSYASSGTTRSSRVSGSTRSRHLPLGLLLGRLPGISMSITCLRLLPCSLRCTCPNHLSLLSLALLFILPTPSSYLISSLFINYFCLSLSTP